MSGANQSIPELLTPSEVAEWLKVSTSTVRRMAERGELPGRRIGNQWRFGSAALLRWLEEGTAA